MSGPVHTHRPATKASPARAAPARAVRRAPEAVPTASGGTSLASIPTYGAGTGLLRVDSPDSEAELEADRAAHLAWEGLPLPADLAASVGGGRPVARIHTGPDAQAAADQLRSDAFTVGSDIYFGAGRYAPGTAAGNALLAHELTHVLQQEAAGDPVIRRARWGSCPRGERLSAASWTRWRPAELQMMGYFRNSRYSAEWTTNENLPFENGATWSPRSRRILRQLQKDFVSEKGGQKRRTVSAQNVATEGPGLEDFAGFATETVAVALAPDIIDFQHREMYDVTTRKLASPKVAKVAGYAGLARGITGLPWRAGKGLPAPGLFWRQQSHLPGEITCFGSTDLTKRPGVLSYEVVSTKKKKDKKKKDKKKVAKKQTPKKKDPGKKPTQKSTPKGAGGTHNIGFGLSLFSTGSGSGNASLGIAINSHGISYGTVSAGVVYDSSSQAVGVIGGGGSLRSSGTGALVAGAGASRDSTSLGVATAGAGLSDESTSAGALTAGAGTSRRTTTAGALTAGSGKTEDVTAAGALTTGSGDTKDVVGVARPRSGGTVTTQGRGAEETRGQDDGSTGGQGDGGAGGPREGGAPAQGPGNAKGSASTPDGGRAAGDRPGEPGAHGLGVPGLTADQADKAVEKAGEMDALLRAATPAQRALMESLVERSGSGQYSVPGTEWVRLITTATEGITDPDVPYLLGLTWEPADVSAEQLRTAVRQALAARTATRRASTSAGEPHDTGGPAGKKRAPAGKKKVSTAIDRGSAASKGRGPAAPTTKDRTKKEGPAESRDELVARLSARARLERGAPPEGSSHIRYGKEYVVGTRASFAVYVRYRASGRAQWFTADVTGVIEQSGGARVFRILSTSTLLVSEDGSWVEGNLAGTDYPLTGQAGGQ